MTTYKEAPEGRAFAFLMPESLRSQSTELIVAGGVIYCHEIEEGLLYPLEAVCTKVEIPGVRYREEFP